MAKVLNVSAVKVPEGVKVKSYKTQTIFEKGSRRIVVKSHKVELTTAPKIVGQKFGLSAVSKEEADRRHLGPTVAAGTIETEKEMSSLLKEYFR